MCGRSMSMYLRSKKDRRRKSSTAETERSHAVLCQLVATLRSGSPDQISCFISKVQSSRTDQEAMIHVIKTTREMTSEKEMRRQTIEIRSSYWDSIKLWASFWKQRSLWFGKRWLSRSGDWGTNDGFIGNSEAYLKILARNLYSVNESCQIHSGRNEIICYSDSHHRCLCLDNILRGPTRFAKISKHCGVYTYPLYWLIYDADNP